MAFVLRTHAYVTVGPGRRSRGDWVPSAGPLGSFPGAPGGVKLLVPLTP